MIGAFRSVCRSKVCTCIVEYIGQYCESKSVCCLSVDVVDKSFVETSVNVISNSPSQDYTHPDDRTSLNYDMTPGFKPFTVWFCYSYYYYYYYYHYYHYHYHVNASVLLAVISLP